MTAYLLHNGSAS